MAIDRTQIRWGFYVGIGLLLAFFVWALISGVLGKALKS